MEAEASQKDSNGDVRKTTPKITDGAKLALTAQEVATQTDE